MQWQVKPQPPWQDALLVVQTAAGLLWIIRSVRDEQVKFSTSDLACSSDRPLLELVACILLRRRQEAEVCCGDSRTQGRPARADKFL